MPSRKVKIRMIGVANTKVAQVRTDALTLLISFLLIITAVAETTEVKRAV